MPVELVFIHGWGFDKGFWDGLCARLPQFGQTRIDLGFFGGGPPVLQGSKTHARVLVGHSFGFVHGMGQRQRQDWDGWIAVNSFPNFVATAAKAGCVAAARLRDMRGRLQTDTAGTLGNFYRLIDAVPTAGMPEAARLLAGLDELRDADIDEMLDALNVPGLAMAGKNDPLVPLEMSEALGRRAKGGGLILHEGGHLLPQTEPDWCARAIADFITANFDRT